MGGRVSAYDVKKAKWSAALLAGMLMVSGCSSSAQPETEEEEGQETAAVTTDTKKDDDKQEEEAKEEETSQDTEEETASEVTEEPAQTAAEETPAAQMEEPEADVVQVASETETATTYPSVDSAVWNGNYYEVNGVAIVNKKHPLRADYAPGENPEAVAALKSLIADMQNLGMDVSNSYSGFRSYEYQEELYNNYCAQSGQAAADTYSARPGYSEHQTGLAFDLKNSNGQLLTTDTEAQWLLDNASRYGFIVRYRPGWESITGYMEEPWHLRYVGSIASDIAASGLTLEQYLGVEGGDYN